MRRFKISKNRLSHFDNSHSLYLGKHKIADISSSRFYQKEFKQLVRTINKLKIKEASPIP